MDFNTQNNWIGIVAAIGSLITAIATVFLACFALKALNAWKYEFNAKAIGELKCILNKIRRATDSSTLPSIGTRFIQEGENYNPINDKVKVSDELENFYKSKIFTIYIRKNNLIQSKIEEILLEFKNLIHEDYDSRQRRILQPQLSDIDRNEGQLEINTLSANRRALVTKIISLVTETEKILT